jgi:hypothetical protein
MKPLYVKLTLAAVWVLAVVIVGLVAGVTSVSGRVAVGAVALLPPIGAWLPWKAPAQTLSESIQEGRR